MRMILKANQRRLLLNRRSIAVLQRHPRSIMNGRVDATGSTIGMWQQANSSLLWANVYIRKQLTALRT
ncbi:MULTISPECIES: hypothetical protein [Bradyrhizobium]|uniref:hypothetical protein n=1 Tax=Bradyrhizobium TaxID=374 RepID=UPI00155F48A7|nr:MULTISPECIES: hypothetical protein [Bradyrhizobium]MDD1520207.1 hypothetical protein [Bradyrhizobium sp. WBAH30]MDD1545096.1 hypothetical protein [Bradyrhizobium sp. WBAH41]MDD1558525.1 hypothetical protein [Bradyrhizobium sp. WBAH23]MDD1591303.1 hypothetical protein [Bradyrhizobium sp. WBAH42]NRB89601.1 hypothetical protein [Bradyrhizobium sp. WBAH10]